MPRILMLVPTATYRAPDFVRAAKNLDVELVVGSEQPQAMAPIMGDATLVVPLDQPEHAAAKIVELARRSAIDAVVAVDDQGSLVAALAGEELGVRHNPPASVAAARDKALMRAILSRSGVVQPDFQVVSEPGGAERAAESIGFPCVLKPTSLSASRGVIRADGAAEAARAESRVRSILRQASEPEDAPLLVERFVAGPEIAVEGLLRDGTLEVFAVFDKPDPLDGPYFEETIYTTPSGLDTAAQSLAKEMCARAARALGLAHGPLHAELRMPDGQPVFIELAARSIGGLCSRALRFDNGMSLEEVVVADALGAAPDQLALEAGATGVMMIPIPNEGTLVEVEGVEGAREVPGVTGIDITIAPGRHVTPLPEGDKYLGFIYARRERPGEVEEALRSAHAKLHVRINS